MRVLLFGATGMVGQGVLRECLLDPNVTEVVTVGRSPVAQQSPKLRQIVRKDLYDLSEIALQLTGVDACFFCLGVSSFRMKEAAYRRVTYDLTMTAAETLAPLNPELTFIFVTGAGTDSSERGRVMWARVKGQTENALLRLPIRGAYMFRPAAIIPLHGIESRTALYRWPLRLLAPLLPLFRNRFPKYVTTTEQIGRAMLRVAREGNAKHVLESADINRL